MGSPEDEKTEEIKNESPETIRPVWGIIEDETAKFRLKEEELVDWQADLERREKEFLDAGGTLPPVPELPARLEGDLDFDDSSSLWDVIQAKALRYARWEMRLTLREDALERGIEGIG